MDKILAFIPARGGSKRLPRKNLLPLGGKPLVRHTIDCARASGQFSEIVVSSDAPEILAIAQASGVTADSRPAHLSGDQVRNVEVLAELLARRPEQFDAVMLLQPTSPFRTPGDIRQAVSLWRSHPEGSIVAVSAYEEPPQFALRMDEKFALEMREPAAYAQSTQKQAIPPLYHPGGSIYLCSVSKFLRTGAFFAPPLFGVVIPPGRALDIDLPHQFAFAEWMMEHHPEGDAGSA